MVLDAFAEKHHLSFSPDRGEYFSVGSNINTSHFYLYKPTTFMNLSGLAVQEIIKNKNTNVDNILIISDDINLPIGNIRFRESGGAGGHNGLNSIIDSLGTNQFNRLRFGVGNKFNKGELADFVLENFYENEKEIIRLGIEFSVLLLEQFIKAGKKELVNFYSKEINNYQENINIETN